MPPHTAVERPACGPAPEAMPSAIDSESETIATVTAAGRLRCTASRSGMRPSVVSTVMKREPDSEVSSEEVSDSSSRSPSFLVPRDISPGSEQQGCDACWAQGTRALSASLKVDVHARKK